MGPEATTDGATITADVRLRANGCWGCMRTQLIQLVEQLDYPPPPPTLSLLRIVGLIAHH